MIFFTMAGFRRPPRLTGDKVFQYQWRTMSQSSTRSAITVVGAGLAGSECAFQLAEMGHEVELIEMRGIRSTPAHKTADFAELVCSNSFGSLTDYSAPGQLKWEAEALGSLILKMAKSAQVPAGMALAVDRELFARSITEVLESHPRIQIRRQVVNSIMDIPRPAVIATGPLTDSSLAQSMREHFDEEFLYFFDAIAPIVDAESIDMKIAYKGDRFEKGDLDYLNCPLTKPQYDTLVEEILNSKKIEPKDFEKDTPYFDGCMPIEEMARRGQQTLRFGPLSPKGLKNGETGERSYAVVQLRQDNKQATAYNMVGFQTKMAYAEQVRIFRTIPGLENAEFLKLGSVHRNLYIQSPKKLSPWLSSRKDPLLFFAGQVSGVEGYFESTCTGLMVAHFLNDTLKGQTPRLPHRASAFGSLLNGITEDNDFFQPTNINFSLFPKVEKLPDDGPAKRKRADFKRARRDYQISLAKSAILNWKTEIQTVYTDPALPTEPVQI